MNKEFAKRLEEYLKTECRDYDMSYIWRWNDDTQNCDALIKRDDHTQYTKEVYFRFEDGDLIIELCEDCWHVTREYDQTVKYFWMLVAPTLFPDA